jgi:hypothetical protein
VQEPLPALDDLTPEGVRKAAQLAFRHAVLRAREDPYAFCLLVGKTDQGEPTAYEDVHAEWHRFLSEHDKAVLYAPVGHAKTTQISRWRVVWEIGHNPNLRVGILSSAKGGMAAKILGGIKADIAENALVREVFPNLRPAAGAQARWSEEAITVDRTESGGSMMDPTVQTFGIGGDILGSRLDLIILDDVHHQQNVLTQDARDKVWDFISGPVFSRTPPGGGRIWFVGHVWHADDALARAARLPGFAASPKYSAFVKDEETGEERPLMPRIWTMERLREKEASMRAVLAKLMMRNQLTSPEEQRIQEAWINTCLRRGAGVPMMRRWNPNDSPTFTGADLSVATPQKARAKSSRRRDLACLFTITILPDGTRRILDVRSGRWQGPRILQEMIEVHQRFGSLIAVENNAAQDFLVQFANELTALPLRRHTTNGSNKWHLQFGIESMGLELEQGKWMIPSHLEGDVLEPASEEVAHWASELLAYTPDEHTGDRLMASWIARECAREAGYGHGAWAAKDDDYFNASAIWAAMGVARPA